jgi:hypothetical protein
MYRTALHSLRCNPTVHQPTPQGIQSRVWVFSMADLQQPLATLPGLAELELTGLALSADGELLAVASGEPGPSLAVWEWREVRRARALGNSNSQTNAGRCASLCVPNTCQNASDWRHEVPNPSRAPKHTPAPL